VLLTPTADGEPCSGDATHPQVVCSPHALAAPGAARADARHWRLPACLCRCRVSPARLWVVLHCGVCGELPALAAVLPPARGGRGGGRTGRPLSTGWEGCTLNGSLQRTAQLLLLLLLLLELLRVLLLVLLLAAVAEEAGVGRRGRAGDAAEAGASASARADGDDDWVPAKCSKGRQQGGKGLNPGCGHQQQLARSLMMLGSSVAAPAASADNEAKVDAVPCAATAVAALQGDAPLCSGRVSRRCRCWGGPGSARAGAGVWCWSLQTWRSWRRAWLGGGAEEHRCPTETAHSDTRRTCS